MLTAYGVINGYLRDIGHHVHNIQRSTSDLEELVAFHEEPLGVENRPGATEMTIVSGDIHEKKMATKRGEALLLF